MFFDRLIARFKIPKDQIRLIVISDEPFIGLAYLDEGKVKVSINALDPERRDDLIASFDRTGLLKQDIFIEALRNVFAKKTNDASECFLRWIEQGNADATLVMAYHVYPRRRSPKKTKDVPKFLEKRLAVSASDPAGERHVTARHQNATSLLSSVGTHNPRALQLERLFLTAESYSWKSDLRFDLMEATATALAKYYSELGNLERALFFVGNLLHQPNRMHVLDPSNRTELIGALSLSPELEQDKFVQALRDVLRQKPRDAFDGLFRWLQDKNDRSSLDLSRLINVATDRSLGGSPHIAVEHRVATDGLNSVGAENLRALTLERLFLTVEAYSWESELRFSLMEAIAIALTKYYGGLGNYERALFYVGIVLNQPTTMYGLDEAHRAELLGALSARPELEQDHFIRAIRNALRRETYDAFEGFFHWLRNEDVQSSFEVLHFINLIADNSVSGGANAATKHSKTTSHLSSAGTENPRALNLEYLFLTVEGYRWKSEPRFGLLEAIAIALSKYYGSLNNYDRALFFVDRALLEPRHSIHLKTTRQVLNSRTAGEPVAPWLEKFIGPDNGYLQDFVCEMPFQRFDIVETGEVNVCCGHWLPKSIGNIDVGELEETLNSDAAIAIRRSVTDGTYKYCNHLECALLLQNRVTRRENVTDAQTKNALEANDFKVKYVENILFAYDQSCNLACPSCRSSRIIEKPSQNEAKAKNVQLKLMPLLGKLKHLEINVAGEVFVSKPSRQILGMVSQETSPNLRIDLISNGTLFTEKEWDKFPGIHGRVNGVRISLDGARKSTIEKLRRFAIYESLVKNLEFLQRLRREGKIGGLSFSFTYQRDNFLEMEEFVEFSRRFDADKIIFEPLQNVGAFTPDQYTERAVHKSTHAQFPDFLEMIRRPSFQAAGIQHDFAGYDYRAFKLARLFLSGDFIPNRNNTFTDGMHGVDGGPESAFYALPTEGRHRILMHDNTEYLGDYSFKVSCKPIKCSKVGVELHTLDNKLYGRILLDLDRISVSHQHSILGPLTNAEVTRNDEGWFTLSFRALIKYPTEVALNIYLTNDSGVAEFAGDPDAGFIAGRIAAKLVTAWP